MRKAKSGPMTSEEVRLALREMDREHDAISVLLEELADVCESCMRRTKDGANAGCAKCVARDVIES